MVYNVLSYLREIKYCSDLEIGEGAAKFAGVPNAFGIATNIFLGE